MTPKLLTLALLTGLALVAFAASATATDAVICCIPPEICEPVSITVDVPPGMNTHEECLPVEP